MSAYINIAVSLILVYLVISLVVTACNEILATILKTRPRMLVQTIAGILGDRVLLDRFYANGLIGAARDSSTAAKEAWTAAGIRGLVPGVAKGPLEVYERGHPSYIKGKNFAKALGMAVIGWKLGDLASKAETAAGDASATAGDVADAADAAAAAVAAFDAGQKQACDAIQAAVAQARANADCAAAGAQAKAAAALAAEAAKTASGGVPTLQDIQGAVGDLPDGSPIKDVLKAAIAGANGTLEGFEKELSAWYDTAQDRLSGAYARYQKYVALAFGAALAILLNVDSVQIAQRASLGSSEMAERTFAAAEEAVAAGAASSCQGEGESEDRTACLVREAMGNLATIDPLLVPWEQDRAWTEQTAPLWIYKMVGLLMTTLAVSLGAPFWFDLLSMFVNIRGAGTKPKEEAR